MIVVDAAAMVDALTMAPAAEAVHARMAAEDLHSPHLIDFEVVSGLRGLVLGRSLSAARAQDALIDFDDLPLTRWPAAGALRRRAFALRHNLSAYDAAYVALAEALGCPLLTRDARIARATGHTALVEVL
ncbi:MAG TPA: type II toxin-antitoxin system VapC family toxin [Pseudonocardiaceae bacterium]|jgi:predicted nucleic acid-binding protein